MCSSVCVGAGTLATAAIATSPLALENARATRILTAPWPDSALPSRFSNARLTRTTRNLCYSSGQFHFCKGFPEVVAQLDGPNQPDIIAYVVTPYSNASRDIPYLGIPVKRVGSVPGRPGSVLAEGAFSAPNTAGQYVTSEEAVAVIAVGKVLVETLAGGNNLGADAASVGTLLSAAIAHLPQ